jgi:hypothetical protein
MLVSQAFKLGKTERDLILNTPGLEPRLFHTTTLYRWANVALIFESAVSWGCYIRIQISLEELSSIDIKRHEVSWEMLSTKL